MFNTSLLLLDFDLDFDFGFDLGFSFVTSDLF